MPTGQDWIDVLDARAAGMVPGFAAHGAPVETADIHPDERDRLDVEHFVAVARPTGDWRDVRIAELETQLGRMTGGPVDPRDARMAELEEAIASARSGQPAAPATPTTSLPDSSFPPSAGTSPPPPPPPVLEREPESATSSAELAELEERFAQLGRQLAQARDDAGGAEPEPPQTEAKTTPAKKAPAKKAAANKSPTARVNS